MSGFPSLRIAHYVPEKAPHNVKQPRIVTCTCGAGASIDREAANYYQVSCSNKKCKRTGSLRMRRIDAIRDWNKEIREYGEIPK